LDSRKCFRFEKKKKTVSNGAAGVLDVRGYAGIGLIWRRGGGVGDQEGDSTQKGNQQKPLTSKATNKKTTNKTPTKKKKKKNPPGSTV